MDKDKAVKTEPVACPMTRRTFSIVLIHDAGPSLPTTFSGEVQTRTVVAS